MKDSIYTIPLSEVLEPKDGCPICRLRNILEDRCLEYIMGAAMMEPDIRIETNREGFCFPHFERMLKAKKPSVFGFDAGKPIGVCGGK